MSEEPIVPPSEGSPRAERAKSPGAVTGADLSQEIIAAVERQPGDEVRCTRVGADTYRCNWWCVASATAYDNPGMKGGQLATDHRIRQSRFLRVTKGRKGLSIEELPSG
jgi:hypothetical protein